MVALFGKAKASGLKFPKVRLVLNGTKVVLSLNGPNSKAPGAVSINGEGQYPNRVYYGRVSPDGVFQPFKTVLPGLVELLTELASNPARVAKDYGKLTGNCCFCGKGVGYGKEERSALVGFGPDCAENYGLKAEWLAAAEKAEAKASVVAPAPVAPVVAVEPVLSASDWVEDGKDFTFAEDFSKEATVVAYAETEYDAVAGVAEVAETSVYHLDVEEPKVCFFCEQASASTKTLHGIVVCAACVAQLA